MELWKYSLDDKGKVTREEYFLLGSLQKVTVYGEGKLRTEEIYKDEELYLKVYFDGDTRHEGRSLCRRASFCGKGKSIENPAYRACGGPVFSHEAPRHGQRLFPPLGGRNRNRGHDAHRGARRDERVPARIHRQHRGDQLVSSADPRGPGRSRAGSAPVSRMRAGAAGAHPVDRRRDRSGSFRREAGAGRRGLPTAARLRRSALFPRDCSPWTRCRGRCSRCARDLFPWRTRAPW